MKIIIYNRATTAVIQLPFSLFLMILYERDCFRDKRQKPKKKLGRLGFVATTTTSYVR